MLTTEKEERNMEHENWYPVDNAARVFLATHTDRDTRSLRVSCTLSESIDAASLQAALNSTIRTRNLFQVRIRRGFFWHYIEHTKAVPVVCEEHERPCPILYGKHHRGILHYSVSYFQNRINVEMFHALTDGTGAMEFLNHLVLQYLKLRHPGKFSGLSLGFSASASELEQNSFSKFYEKSEKMHSDSGKAYHISGLHLPHQQLQFFRVAMPAAALLSAAKGMNVTLTSYIAARLMLSIYRDMPSMKRSLPVTLSIPVNLRNFYETETARNFFNSISVSHRFTGTETLSELAQEFDAQMKASLTPEYIHKRMANFQRLERLMALRLVPLCIKQPVIRFFAGKESRKVSAVFSNLGIIRVPEPLRPYIQDYTIFCSHAELYISACTYKETLYLGITNGYRNTSVLQHFITGFEKDGIAVELEATEVIRE